MVVKRRMHGMYNRQSSEMNPYTYVRTCITLSCIVPVQYVRTSSFLVSSNTFFPLHFLHLSFDLNVSPTGTTNCH